jgi:hypothetical protein
LKYEYLLPYAFPKRYAVARESKKPDVSGRNAPMPGDVISLDDYRVT